MIVEHSSPHYTRLNTTFPLWTQRYYFYLIPPFLSVSLWTVVSRSTFNDTHLVYLRHRHLHHSTPTSDLDKSISFLRSSHSNNGRFYPFGLLYLLNSTVSRCGHNVGLPSTFFSFNTKRQRLTLRILTLRRDRWPLMFSKILNICNPISLISLYFLSLYSTSYFFYNELSRV